MIEYRFNPQKARQLAAGFLRLSPNHTMNYTKLIKLMYLADRQRLIKTGTPITGDRFVSMPHGPVLTTIYDRIKSRVRDTDWMACFRTDNFDLILMADPGDGELSRFDEELIHDLYQRFENYDYRAMIQYCHDELDEWEDPHGSSYPIEYKTVLKVAGKSDSEIEAIKRLAKENFIIDYCLDEEETANV